MRRLLDLPQPKLRAYPPETAVAEKFQAMTALGMINSRMKDFFDLWAIGSTFAFDGHVLAKAITATFARRETPLPTEPPLALTPAFAEAKQAQWTAFLKRTEISLVPEPFPEIPTKVATLVMPPTVSLTKGEAFSARRPAGGDWTG